MHKSKILIVDDDAAICDAVAMLLEEFGYEVESILEGQKIYNLKKPFPQVVLLDIWMSGVDGRDICKYLKQREDTKHIPIIMISANKDIQKIAKECNGDDFLAKPFEINDLLERINSYVKTS